MEDNLHGSYYTYVNISIVSYNATLPYKESSSSDNLGAL